MSAKHKKPNDFVWRFSSGLHLNKYCARISLGQDVRDMFHQKNPSDELVWTTAHQAGVLAHLATVLSRDSLLNRGIYPAICR